MAIGLNDDSVNGLYESNKIVQTLCFENSYVNSISSGNKDIESANGIIWEISITPKKTSSYILLMLSSSVWIIHSSSVGAYGNISISRKIGNSTYSQIYSPSNVESRIAAGGATVAGLGYMYNKTIKDSPSSISPITYKFNMLLGVGTTFTTPNTGSMICNLIEIGG